MRTRFAKIVLSAFLVAVVVLAVMTARALSGGQPSDLPGWYQAVLSVIALLATAALFFEEQARTVEEAVAKEAALARVAVEMTMQAYGLVGERLDSALSSVQDKKTLFALRGHRTTEMVQAMRELEISSLPADLTKHFAYARSGVFAINERISDVYRSDHKNPEQRARRVARLKSSGRVLRDTGTHLDNLSAAAALRYGIRISRPHLVENLEAFVQLAMIETESEGDAFD